MLKVKLGILLENLSPMCRFFSQLMNISKNSRDQEKFERNRKIVVEHLIFCLELCKLQEDSGRYFLLEQPAGAASWREPKMVEFLSQFAGTILNTGHLCEYGLTTTDRNGKACPAKKLTRWMTNSTCLAKALGTKCMGAPSCPLDP